MRQAGAIPVVYWVAAAWYQQPHFSRKPLAMWPAHYTQVGTDKFNGLPRLLPSLTAHAPASHPSLFYVAGIMQRPAHILSPQEYEQFPNLHKFWSKTGFCCDGKGEWVPFPRS